MLWFSRLAVIAVAAIFSGVSSASPLAGTVFERVGQERNIAPSLLYAIAMVESGVARTHSDVSPWPFTLRVRHFNFYGESRDEAAAVLAEFIDEHGTNVDVGLGQINLRWHGHRVESPVQLLDVETNLRVMSDILQETIASSRDPELQIGRYHSWREDRARSYAKKVFGIQAAILAAQYAP